MYIISTNIVLQINVSFYLKTLSEKLVLSSLQTFDGLIFSCASLALVQFRWFPDSGLSEWQEDQCFLCRVTRLQPGHAVTRSLQMELTRPGCASGASALCPVLQTPVRKIALEVSALLIPFTETKFQEANRAESAKDEMLEIKLMKLNHQFVT